MTLSLLVVPSEKYATAAAAWLAEQIETVIATRGECTIALCGGSTPVPVYHALAALEVDWSRVAIFFGDERAVAPDSADSNYAMAMQALIGNVEIPSRRIYRMAAERPDRAAAAAEYERLLPSSFDLLLLGVGPDGHTASLFPGEPSLQERTHRVLAVPRPPLPLQPQVDRMTITPPVIAAASRIAVLVTGGEKAALLARILDGAEQPTDLPAQLARRGIWILDDAAASHLQPRDT